MSLRWNQELLKDRPTTPKDRYRRWSPSSSPNRSIEPMDLDLSPDSHPPSSHPAVSADIPDVDQDFDTASNRETASPISWKVASYAIGSVLTLRNRPTSTPLGHSKISASNYERAFSTPPFSSVNMLDSSTAPSSINVTSSNDLSSGIVHDNVFLSRKRKRGFGIPDTDSVFSQYPKNSDQIAKITDVTKAKNHFLKKSESEVKKRSKTSSSLDNAKKKSWLAKCCFILVLPFIFIITLSLLAHFHFNYCKSSIHFRRSALEQDFKSKLFGQHIAASLIPGLLQHYYDKFTSLHYSESNSSTLNLNSAKTCKPLTLSFHGWTGVGKTYVSRLISQSFHNAQFNLINIPLIFPHRSQPFVEAEIMFKQIEDSLSHCKVNILIIDEMDKALEGVSKGLSNVIQKLSSQCSAWYPTIFILLSNTHAIEINLLYKQLLATSKVSTREEMTASHFESIFKKKNEWYDPLIDAQQIDMFIPFLPLEKKHAIQCIEQDLLSKNIPVSIEKIDAVLRELRFSEQGNLVFSATGCKRVSDKIDYINSGKEGHYEGD